MSEAFEQVLLKINKKDLSKVKKYIQHLQKIERFKIKSKKRFMSLSKRERHVYACVISDFSNRQTSEWLGIKQSTVETHRKKINKKLNIKSINDLRKYSEAYPVKKPSKMILSDSKNHSL